MGLANRLARRHERRHLLFEAAAASFLRWATSNPSWTMELPRDFEVGPNFNFEEIRPDLAAGPDGRIYGASLHGAVYAFDMQNREGERIFNFHETEGFFWQNRPIVGGDGTMYLGYNTLRGGFIWALDTSHLWENPVSERPDHWDPVDPDNYAGVTWGHFNGGDGNGWVGEHPFRWDRSGEPPYPSIDELLEEAPLCWNEADWDEAECGPLPDPREEYIADPEPADAGDGGVADDVEKPDVAPAAPDVADSDVHRSDVDASSPGDQSRPSSDVTSGGCSGCTTSTPFGGAVPWSLILLLAALGGPALLWRVRRT